MKGMGALGNGQEMLGNTCKWLGNTHKHQEMVTERLPNGWKLCLIAS